MNPSITREQAIEQLRSFGFDARARDWAFGETICIPLGEPETVSLGPRGSITVYPGVLYLYPDDGGWSLMDTADMAGEAAVHYRDLASAVGGAREYAQQWERARAVRR